MDKYPVFSHIYIEKEAQSHPLTEAIVSRFSEAKVIEIGRYMDVFSSTHQDFCLKKSSQKLILAKSHGSTIHPGAPVCQSFGNDYFYYTSGVMNCIYDCEYCYLQGMYDSSDIVVFVNLEDTFSELTELLSKHSVYLCISYDTDLLPLESLLSFVRKWTDFTIAHPNLTVECRTKSATPPPKGPSCSRFIYAYTVSPDLIAERFEHKTPGLSSRLKAANAAMEAGYQVRLCFDPVIHTDGWKEAYAELIREAFTRIDSSKLLDVSLGSFRISKSYLASMRKKRPASEIVNYPFETSKGYYSYPKDIEEAITDYMTQLISQYISRDKIYLP